MDDPSAGSHSGRRPAASRSMRASASGGVALIADLPVLVRIEPGASAAAAAGELFGRLPPGLQEPANEIFVARRAPRRPSGPPDEVYGDLWLWRHGHGLVVDGLRGLRARVTPGRAVIGGGVGASDALGAFRQVCHHAVPHLLATAGRFVVHGAAVARDSAAVLLLGATGGGKSTASYAAARAGWLVLADDLVVVRPVDGGCELVGVHRLPTIPGDVFVGSGVPLPGDPRGRIAADLPLHPGPVRAAAVALVENGAGPGGHLERVAPVDAAKAVLFSFPSAGYPPVTRAGLGLAARLATLPVFRLGLPAPADARLEGAVVLLERVLAAQ